MKTCGLIVFFLLVSWVYSSAQLPYSGNWERKESKEIKSLVESGEFLFTADCTFKRSGQKVPLSYGYDLRIDHDFVACWLPDLEKSQTWSNRQSERLQFRQVARSSRMLYDERNRSYQIFFDVDTDSERLHLQMRIGVDGKAQLTVISDDREAVRFEGEVVSMPARSRSI